MPSIFSFCSFDTPVVPQSFIVMANGLNSEEMRIMTLPSLLRPCDVLTHCTLKANPLPHSGNITHMQFLSHDDDDDDEFVAVAVSYGNEEVTDSPCGVYDAKYYQHEQTCRCMEGVSS